MRLGGLEGAMSTKRRIFFATAPLLALLTPVLSLALLMSSGSMVEILDKLQRDRIIPTIGALYVGTLPLTTGLWLLGWRVKAWVIPAAVVGVLGYGYLLLLSPLCLTTHTFNGGASSSSPYQCVTPILIFFSATSIPAWLHLGIVGLVDLVRWWKNANQS